MCVLETEITDFDAKVYTRYVCVLTDLALGYCEQVKIECGRHQHQMIC